MTDRELTDAEVVKALECRILTGLRKINKCGKCKYVKSDACNIRGLITDALDLINRQNEQLKANFDSRQTNECENIDVARFEAEINHLQAKLDEAEDTIQFADKEFKKAEAEVERLKYCNETNISSIATLHEQLKTTKAESYKEFAELAVERVEKAKAKYQRLCKEQGEEMEEHMHVHFNGITKIINNLLKELVGEDNARKT